MPGLDGRGPLGEGAMTGRRMGRCVVNDDKSVTITENVTPIYGRGRGGMPRGGGRMPMGGRGMSCGRGRGMALGGRGMRFRSFQNDSRGMRP